MSKPRILGIPGSLRRESFSVATLRGLHDAIAPDAQLVIHPLNDVPLYNQDEDVDPAPEGVARLRQAIAEADGVVIVSPEFNYGVPGVLKNALDWASRPYGQSALIGKPTLIATESPATTGGVRAQAGLTETLIAIGARVVQRPQIVIGSIHQKVEGGRLTDEATLSFLEAGARDLIREIELRRDLRAAA
jgi:chromate reductase